MIALLMSLLACTDDPKAKMMGPRAACFTLKDEVADKCLTMATEALARKDGEGALFGLTIACGSGLDEACEAATRLPTIGVERYDASLAVGRACFEQERKPACLAYLTLQEGAPEATPKLVEHARSIVSISASTAAPDADAGGE